MFGTDAGRRPALTSRLRRTLELVYGVEGVIAARVWARPSGVSVGVHGGRAFAPTDLLWRVEAAVAALRDPAEVWDFGILQEPKGLGPL